MILLLTGLALILFATLLGWLIWAIHSGQWDDLDTPPQRMLGDDPPADGMTHQPIGRQPQPRPTRP